jgi:uridine kinase
MKNPYIIGIGGTSGVGKTTIANIISILFKNETFLILSGDDLHKWERNDLNWQIYTHFNPKANNIKKGYDDLKNLKNFSSIYRKKYNHETGKFDEIKLITSKENIIYEGLHSLYDKDTLDLIDLKIFIDTDKDLTEKWKIKRDIKKRGYTEKEVKDIINRRKIDKKKFIEPQKNNADIIFKFYEDNSNKINLDCVFCKPNFIEISEKIKNIYNINNTFFTLSKILSTDVSLIQGSSGNISIKYDDKLMIKSSGYKISQINLFDGYIICQKFNKQNNFIDENEYNEDVKKNIYHGNGYPSMEIGFHNFLKNKIIIHTHPIYLNCILCSKESYEIINKLFNFLNYEYINYITPGYELANYFIENKNNYCDGLSKLIDLNK